MKYFHVLANAWFTWSIEVMSRMRKPYHVFGLSRT
jgi:hypothetical protein